MRAALPLLLATALLAACGGETVTETVEVAPSGADDRARPLARDVCGAIPPALLAPFLGADAGDAGRLGEQFSELVRPELRDAAREGCADGAGQD